MIKNIFISAGEASGDIHATNLIKDLKKLSPDLAFSGIGGKRMEEAGVNIIERMDKFSIIGVWEAIINLGHVHRIYNKIMKQLKAKKPDVAILIDYPGFNLTLAKALKRIGVKKVVYYITPQVWVWGAFRINLIRKYVDKAVVILKFEEDLFKKHGVDVTFVGHPLLDHGMDKVSLDKKSLNLDENKKIIALLPGSRKLEVTRMLPLMLKTADILKKKSNVQFALLKSSGVDEEVYQNALKDSPLRLTVFSDDTARCLSISDFVLTSSGTATLECAIMERPMIITYKTSFSTFLAFKLLSKTPFIGLVNIIAKKEVSPEVAQYDATPERLASRIFSIISSNEELNKQINDLRQVKCSLGTPGASKRTAEIINNLT